MLKKVLGLVIAVIMFLGIFGLTACNNNALDAYKTAGKSAIETYAQERKDNYCEDNWTVVYGLVTAGKAAVGAAESKASVDMAVATTKAAIDCIEPLVEGAGAFYNLQKAFDNGWLTKEALQSIAYYHNDDSMPVHPDALNIDIAEKIKYNFVNYVNCQDAEHDIQIKYYGTYNGCVSAMIDGCQHYLDVEGLESVDGVIFYYGSSQRILIWRETETAETVDDVTVTEYLGTYGGSFVAALNDSYNTFFTEVEIPLEIDGLDFSYSNGYPIRVWNSGKIYELVNAYEQELLTKENLQAIYNLYNNKTEQQKI